MANGNDDADSLPSGGSMVTMNVDKLNEMLRNVVANALASHLTPPETPVILPTLEVRSTPHVRVVNQTLGGGTIIA
ncbi:hypothetical protein ACS0TY_024614 [Phlomoides rotata]